MRQTVQLKPSVPAGFIKLFCTGSRHLMTACKLSIKWETNANSFFLFHTTTTILKWFACWMGNQASAQHIKKWYLSKIYQTLNNLESSDMFPHDFHAARKYWGSQMGLSICAQCFLLLMTDYLMLCSSNATKLLLRTTPAWSHVYLLII